MDLAKDVIVRCLCNLKFTSEFELETHIDNSHAEIFRFSTTSSTPPKHQDSLNTQSLGLLENQWYPSSGYANSLPENRNSRKTTTSLVSYQQPQSFQASNKAYQKENSYTTESKITNAASYFGNEEEKGKVGERKKRSYSVVSQMPHVNKKIRQEQTNCYVNQQKDFTKIELEQRPPDNDLSDYETITSEDTDPMFKFRHQEELQKNLYESEVRNRYLEQRVAELTTENFQLQEKNRESVTASEDLNKASNLIAQLNDSLKSKTTKLAQSKVLVGQLQIQVNKMIQDWEQSKSNCNIAQSKLSTIMQSYKSLQADSERYKIVKVAMKKVFENDEKHCSQIGDSFCTLDEDGICDVIQSFIFESFEAKVNYQAEMKNGIDRVLKLHNRNIMQNKVIKKLTDTMKAQNAVLARKQMNEIELKRAVKSITNQSKTIETRRKEILELKSLQQKDKLTIESLKDELILFEASNEENLQEISDLKKGFESFQKMTAATNKNNLDLEKLLEESREKNAHLGKLNEGMQVFTEELKSELTEIQQYLQICLDSQAEHKNVSASLKEHNELLQKENNQSKTHIEELQLELREIDKEACLLKQKFAEHDQKECESHSKIDNLKKELKDGQAMLKLKEEKIAHLEEDLQKAQEAKSELEENVAEIKKSQIKQEADFVEALQKHSVGLKSMKSEVTLILIEKEGQITLLTDKLKSKEELVEGFRSQILKLSTQLEMLKSKIEKLKYLTEEHNSTREQLVSLKNNLKQGEVRISELEEKVNVLEGEKDKMSQKLLYKDKQNKTERVKLKDQVRQAVRDKKHLEKEKLEKESELEASKRHSHGLEEEMKFLKLEASNSSRKMDSLQQDHKQAVKDMTWAKNYCSSMDKKIKDLENELSKYRPILREPLDQRAYPISMQPKKEVLSDLTESRELIRPKTRRGLTKY